MIKFIKHIVLFLLILSSGYLCVFHCNTSYAQYSAPQTISYNPVQKDVILKYSKIGSKNRFVFDFPENSKISYNIKSDEKSTTIIFSRIFRLETLDLTNFDKYSEITQKKISARQMEISFPLPLLSSVEHLNSIILDLADHKEDISKTLKDIVPLQISSLGFSWNTPVALSVFKREKYLWIVFNQYKKVNIDELKKSAGDMVKDIIQLPHRSATILRLEARDKLYSEVRKEGLLWVVDLYDREAERSFKPIIVKTDQTVPQKPSIVVNLPNIGDTFRFLDPEVGDMLMAITSSDPGRAFISGYKYADFTFLPSSQGMAISSDDFGINIIRNSLGFILQTDSHPLNLSKDLEAVQRQSILSMGKGDISIIKELSIPIIKNNFRDSESYLQDQIELASDEDRDNLKIELTRFYLSYGLGTNALGVLRDIKASYKEKNKRLTPQIRVLSGVASFLANRYDVAQKIFSNSEFENNQDVILWKTLAGDNIDIDFPAIVLQNLNSFYSYPEKVRHKLLFRAVDNAIKINNEDITQKLLNILKEGKIDNEGSAALNYYEAEKVRMQGYFKNALPLYVKAANGASEYFSAMARFQIADFNSSVSGANNDHIIAEFERLKYAWGEKHFKIKVLNKLVDLYLDDNNFYQVLKTLSLISSLSAKQKTVVEQRMIQIMEELYYYNNDFQFNSIKALALFDDFGYLISRSIYQTEMIIKLADRLVAIDLLDRAYNLLDNYILTKSQYLSPQEISAMGSRMALINMFRNNPKNSLRDLETTDYDNISDDLASQRKIIKAKAYVLLKEPEKALELLRDDFSRNAILLKLEIFWDNEQWNEASNMLRLLVERPKKGQPLSDEQIGFVLDWLTALKQAQKDTVIVRIRNTFLPFFEKTQYISIFNLLTQHLEDDKISINDIHTAINNVKAFSNFATKYTQSLMNGNTDKSNDAKQ